MKARWIIENFTDSQDYRDLIDKVRELGLDCYVIDKRNHFDFDPTKFKENECVIMQGSIQMVKHIKSKIPTCFPISYSNFDNFLCSTYYPKFPGLLFNDKHEFVMFGELKEKKFDLYLKYGKEAMIFVRPDSGEKSFTGQLVDIQDFDKFVDNQDTFVQPNDLVIISTPKTINGEWRFLCDGTGIGSIIDCSTYQYQGKRTIIPSAPLGAYHLVNDVLEVKWRPDTLFCVDVCQDADGKFWLLELTSFSSAGLYAMNKEIIARVVTEVAEMEYKIKYEQISRA